MRVLALAAHPDDVELLCAGTLARFSREAEVVLAHLTYGDKGGRQSLEELAQTRRREAEAAAALIGARTVGRICGDLELYRGGDHAAAVGGMVANGPWDAVLTHRPDDYHPDHRITGELALDAVAKLPEPPPLWFMDTIGGVEFHPTHLVDISDVIQLKKKMIRCHESQMSWMSAARHTDMEYMIEWTARWRGLQAGTGYAEGFTSASGPGASWFGPPSVPAVPPVELP